MRIVNTESFRKYLKDKRRLSDRNENFIGYNHENKFGFFDIFHGNKPDIEGYLQAPLQNAENEQSFYEFIQNADDCKSQKFAIFGSPYKIVLK